MDAAAKVTQIGLVGHHATGDELGVSGNRRERRLELMRDVCRELAAHAIVVGKHAHLALELLTLALDTIEHRFHLGIHILAVALGMIQIDLEQRSDDRARRPTRRHERNEQQHDSQQHNRKRHRGENRQDAVLLLRKAHHGAVIEANCLVKHDLAQRGTRAFRRSAPGLDRIGNLGAVRVVLHFLRRLFAVVQDRAVGVDKRDALAIEGQALEHRDIVDRFVERGSDDSRLVAQLATRNAGHVALEVTGPCQGENRDHQERDAKDGCKHAPEQ